MIPQPLNFYFTTKDPKFETHTTVVSSEPGNYISHVFVKAPLYDFTDKLIGYKVTDDYVQQVAENKYIVRLNNTYYLEGRGTVSWQYVFENNTNTVFYPVNINASSNIISTTGEFYGNSGMVSLFPKSDGSRLVNVTFL
jgi:phosphoribosylformylglycinamidine (FGAM) synthase-like amidotransferase family enzyme